MALEHIKDILALAVKHEASDVHLAKGKSIIFRVNGRLVPVEAPPLELERLNFFLNEIISEREVEVFNKTKELDISYSCMDNFQFRVNLAYEKGAITITIRITSMEIKTREALGLPPILDDLARRRKGLLIFAGTAGSGKSTTLTYLVDLINRERKCKIITIEDPIEYVHPSKNSLIIQREVGVDTNSFGDALKYALRQDPDVVVVGEIRDFESISMALTTAETGHLVLTTVHAPDSIETINRIIDVFPVGHKQQICAQLASNLIGVVSQTLIPRKDAEERVLATEIMVGSMAVQNLIRRQAFVEIRGQLDAESNSGMHSLEFCLSEFVKNNVITRQTALEYAKFPKALKLDAPKKFEQQFAQAEENVTLTLEHKQRVRILIVDESFQNAEAMRACLREAGYSQLSILLDFENVDESMMQDHPNIIILDVGLKRSDSFELCNRLKRNSMMLSVIMITGNLQPADLNDAKEAGADEFVVKTKSYDLLLKATDRMAHVYNQH